ncbi:hypothetical protein [Kordia jejudonensis]|uniref:hypothetical protein n=1 Tax=Kordia jejudonensis TaxID=1348245 RepID=UPI0006296E4F|nr:hypothetical protein [Kordia jejudonensis]
MKKQKLKLGLNKIDISNLSNIHGGGPKQAYTITQVGNMCCPVLGSEECPNTQETTCWSGHPGCQDPDPSLHCTATITVVGIGC